MCGGCLALLGRRTERRGRVHPRTGVGCGRVGRAPRGRCEAPRAPAFTLLPFPSSRPHVAGVHPPLGSLTTGSFGRGNSHPAPWLDTVPWTPFSLGIKTEFLPRTSWPCAIWPLPASQPQAVPSFLLAPGTPTPLASVPSLALANTHILPQDICTCVSLCARCSPAQLTPLCPGGLSPPIFSSRKPQTGSVSLGTCWDGSRTSPFGAW